MVHEEVQEDVYWHFAAKGYSKRQTFTDTKATRFLLLHSVI